MELHSLPFRVTAGVVLVTLVSACNLFEPVTQTGDDAGVASDMTVLDGTTPDAPADDMESPADVDDTTPDVRPDMIPENCGDGEVDDDEQCDEGQDNSQDPNATCRLDCQSRRCSDGVVDDESGEECDDGNRRSHDGCSSTCLLESPVWSRLQYPHAIRNHAMAYDAARDVIVLFGGRGRDPDDRWDQTWEFDGTSWTKLSPATSPSPRMDARMAYDPLNERVILFGGNLGGGNLSDETWFWDGSDWARINTPNTPPPRADHGLVWVPGVSKIVLFGGEADVDRHEDLWAFDGSDWTELSPLGNSAPGPREEFAMAADGSTVWVQGGEIEAGTAEDLWELDFSSNDNGRWTVRDQQAPQLENHRGVAEAGTGQFLVFGGEGDSDALFRWTGAAWERLTRAAPWPSSRAAFGAVWDSNRNRMVVAGGNHPAGELADVWGFDDAGWELVASDHPTARDDVTMVYDVENRRVVLFGGDDPDSVNLYDTWTLSSDAPGDAIRWEKTSDAGPSLETPGMAYDESAGVTVLFGGRDLANAPSDETWVFDGSWSQRSPADSPSPRYWANLVYDRLGERPLLISGCAGNDGTEDTWAWSGETWQELQATIPVDIHCLGRAVYDLRRERVVMLTRTIDEAMVTLEFDGDAWSTVQGALPPPREETGMAYDPLAGRSLIFGGLTSPDKTYLDETWAYDGSDWSQVVTGEPIPPEQHGSGMVYDPVRRTTIVFGGRLSAGNEFNTWTIRWENASVPEELCGNEEDDDLDGVQDCDDPDCEFHPGCR